MFGITKFAVLILLFVCMVEGAKRNAQCDLVCQRKMTIECCECIGCHQGMRFGKRSQPFSTPEFEEAAIAAAELTAVEQALLELELEIAAARAPSRRLVEKFNH
ncbi:Protein CBG16842 [Caenorhabditis briggsae]|uniref:Uncharacterized protein n=2 Tax=Caenorhabditis briggsae TaxID=6238 RepID=A0AAE9JST6_CAEBR|nr:Protein CBG16842 [Caenorhabditis briggsae]ULT83291.1 hypothetical protein L3Y34_012495 [Caenorhabditis briggsae]UMM42572.1 hypothetical protein L5515_018351 [Caenorhabditis briggsae]CAP34700.1 Protein CBG16842 [Caenorhabditis briggsae]